MKGRRGTRTIDRSDSGADHESDNGAPDDDETRSQPDGGSGQDSERGNPNDKTEHPDDGSSHSQYDHDDAESEEWKKILSDNASLRKSKEHADRKITELGQDNSRLRQRDSGPESDLEETVESVVTRVLSKQSGNGSDADGQSRDEYESVFKDYGIDDQDEGGGDSKPPSKLENVMLGMYADMKGIQKDLSGVLTERKEQASLTEIQSELGVTEEAARVLMEKAGPGADVVGLVKAAELSSLPREARRLAKEDRWARRASIGHPTAAASRSVESDTDTMKSEIQEIGKMPNSREKQDRLFKFLEDFPDGDELLRSSIGIGN